MVSTVWEWDKWARTGHDEVLFGVIAQWDQQTGFDEG
jgi:hypothetical protein